MTSLNIYKKHMKIIFTMFGHDQSILRRVIQEGSKVAKECNT